MAGTAALARSRERIARMCSAPGDALALRIEVLAELRRAIGFDAHAWLITDPETCVGAAPLAEVPFLAELPRLIGLKYLTPVNRWTALGRRGVARLHDATGGDLSRSLVWRELLSAHGVVDVASAVFRDRFGCWGFLDLWRLGGSSRFGDVEAGLLAELVPAVTAGLRRTQAAAFVAGSARSAPRLGPVVLLLSPRLEVLAQTPETQEFLRVLVPPPEGRSPIPASAYNVAAQLVAVEAGVDANPPWARVHLAGGLWLTLRAARIGEAAEGSDRDIAVTLEQSSAAERVGLFARAAGLSARETELLGHLASGLGTRELAGRLFVSENTVQDHLKSVFAKTGTRSRPALLSRALGT